MSLEILIAILCRLLTKLSIRQIMENKNEQPCVLQQNIKMYAYLNYIATKGFAVTL